MYARYDLNLKHLKETLQEVEYWTGGYGYRLISGITSSSGSVRFEQNMAVPADLSLFAYACRAVDSGGSYTGETLISTEAGRWDYVDANVQLFQGATKSTISWPKLSSHHAFRAYLLESPTTFVYVPDNLNVIDEAAKVVESSLNIKLHKHTIPKLKGWLEWVLRYAKANRTGDLPLFDPNRLYTTIVRLNTFIVQRMPLFIGTAFKGLEPYAVLAQPNFDACDNIVDFKATTTRLGKWLQPYKPGVDIRGVIEDIKATNAPVKTYLCKTQEEWHQAYESGPSSCMTGYSYAKSPVRVYASEDNGLLDNGLRLFITYTGELFGDDFDVTGRAIVNITNMGYVRAYGKGPIDAILRSHGYKKDLNCTDRCMLAKIEHPTIDGAYLMPYQDGNADWVEDVDSHWVLNNNCDGVEATDADGWVTLEPHVECECCGDSVHADDATYNANYEHICQHCLDSYYVMPFGRDEYYLEDDCVYSEHEDCWLLTEDALYCDIVGWVCDNNHLVNTENGYTVLDEYAQYCDVDDKYYLTEQGCSELALEYIDPPTDSDEE